MNVNHLFDPSSEGRKGFSKIMLVVCVCACRLFRTKITSFYKVFFAHALFLTGKLNCFLPVQFPLYMYVCMYVPT